MASWNHDDPKLQCSEQEDYHDELDDSDELARLKAGPPTLTAEGLAELEHAKPGPIVPFVDDARNFLRELLADLETQRDIAKDETLKRIGAKNTSELVVKQHWAAIAHTAGRIAEHIRYFLETPAKEHSDG